MYVPKLYKVKSEEVVFHYIEQNNFATIIGQLNQKSIAVHIPVYLSKEGNQNYLTGHVAIQNEMKHCFDDSQELLAIFMNTHAYVSSSWYNHINVPTWNYIAIHIYGSAKKLNQEDLRFSLQQLVDRHEKGRTPAFDISQMEQRQFDRQLKGIIGFKMRIKNIEASYKLSQNRDDQDYESIIAQLEKSNNPGDQEVAKAMKNNRLN